MTLGCQGTVLILTPEWPVAQRPLAGQFVRNQVDALKELGVQTEVMHFRGRARGLTYASVYRQLRKSLRSRSYALVHAHWGQAGLLATSQRIVPSVLTLHGSDVFGNAEESAMGRTRSLILMAATRLAARRATAVIAVSDVLARRVRREDAYVIPMGIDLRLFRPGSKAEARSRLGWAAQDEVVLFVGDPASPIKRCELARAAVERLNRIRPQVRLKTCFGETPERVVLHYWASDVLVITSTHEGGPLVAWEALACNLPVVSVDVGAVRARLQGIDRCEVVASHSPIAFCDALNRSLGSDMASAGRSAVLDLDRLAVAARVAEVYSHVVSERDHRARSRIDEQ